MDGGWQERVRMQGAQVEMELAGGFSPRLAVFP